MSWRMFSCQVFLLALHTEVLSYLHKISYVNSSVHNRTFSTPSAQQ